jgi:hypothetical protein
MRRSANFRCLVLDEVFRKRWICEKALFHKLNNRDRVDLMSAFAKKNEQDPEIRDAILHCVLCYDICTENRNILMHSTYFDVGDAVKLVKRASKDPTREIHFDVPLGQLRRLADETAGAFVYAVGVFGFISRKMFKESSPLPVQLPELTLPKDARGSLGCQSAFKFGSDASLVHADYSAPIDLA